MEPAAYDVVTYIKLGDRFVLADEVDCELPDVDYIEGAILLRIGGVDILTCKHWDLVDQLWAYLLDGLSSVRLGKDFETCFPDQPLVLKLRRHGKGLIEVIVGEVSRTVPLVVFGEAVVRGASQFCKQMELLAPGLEATWGGYSRLADELYLWVMSNSA